MTNFELIFVTGMRLVTTALSVLYVTSCGSSIIYEKDLFFCLILVCCWEGICTLFHCMDLWKAEENLEEESGLSSHRVDA